MPTMVGIFRLIVRARLEVLSERIALRKNFFTKASFTMATHWSPAVGCGDRSPF
jgi:hypothetical protein